MKKILILLITIFVSYSLQAQCLGEDCSIKGRNQARKQKAAKMTGKRGGGGSLYSVGGGKKKKRKSGGSGGFDPFAGGGKSGKGSTQGFDPFAEADKKGKKKGGQGYDPFASNAKGKNKGRGGSQGFDPFDDKKKGKGRGMAQGYDPFEADKKSKRGKSAGGTWNASDGKKKLKVNYSSPYNDWDTNSARGGRSRGRANDSWADGAGGNKSITKGGTWNEGSKGRKGRGRGSANDSWVDGAGGNKSVGGGGNLADGFGGGTKRRGSGRGPADTWGQGSERAGVNSGGGVWARGGNTRSNNRSNRHQSGSNNWDAQSSNGGGGMEAPRYQRTDNTPKSYSDFEGGGASSDLIYDSPRQYKYNLIGGKIYQHEAEQKTYLSGAELRPVLGAEFCIEWPSVGSKNWHHYFNIPTTGLAFTYLNLGNDELLGSAFAIYPYVDIPLLSTDPFDFNLTTGFGASYVTKWNKQSPSNIDGSPVSEVNPMFGSPLNVYVKGGFNMVLRPFTRVNSQKSDALSHYSFFLGGYMVHMSNGNFASPNSGLNLFTAEAGVKYCPSVLTPVIRKSGEELPHFLTLDFMASGGVRELHRNDTEKYPVGNFNMALYYQMGNIYRLGVGVDGFYDEAFADTHDAASRFTGLYDPTKIEDRIKAGACLSNEFVIGRVTAALDGGYYFYNNVPEPNMDAPFDNMYFRLAMKYHVTTGLFGVLAFKSHKLNAEFLTLGLGYSIGL